jgi:uncharacterized damage-inducible protein DinB
MTHTADLSFPIGRFDREAPISPDMRAAALREIAALPGHLRSAVAGLDDDRLETPYRPGGWTVRQVVHHVADSHMNGFIRMKLALTEDTPTIKPYDQDAWAMLPDMKLPIEVSLSLVDAVHQRWAAVAAALTSADVERAFRHPDLGTLTVDRHLQLYAWHSRHHVAHITRLRERQGW